MPFRTVNGAGSHRTDHRGRIAERAVLRAMGWVPGDRVRVRRGLVLLSADPRGARVVTSHGHLKLSARCGSTECLPYPFHTPVQGRLDATLGR